MRHHLSIYLIDDDPDDHDFFAMAIARMDIPIKLEIADNGPEAIHRLATQEEYNPDLIFIDMNMPGINGLDCLQQIKKIDRLSCVALYMWSTSTDFTLTQKCISMGATQFIKKVPSIALLKEVLWTIFSQQRIVNS